MTFSTIVNGKIINSKNTGVSNATVNLWAVTQQNTLPQYRQTAFISSSTTDGGGFVQFSGVAVGTYDIIVSSGSAYTLYNYEVKNEYVVVPGDASIVVESRTFIRSSEHFSGVTIANPERPNNQLGYPDRDYTVYDQYTLLDLQTDVNVNRLDDTEISGTFANQRETSDTRFVDNQNVKLVQNFTFKLPI